MRYLKPKGTPVKINDKVHYLLFTLNVIDELQDRAQMSMNELISLTAKKKYRKAAVKLILKHLTGEEIEIPDSELEYYSFVLMNTYIEQLKFDGMPKAKDTDSEEIPFVNVRHWFYVGIAMLNRPTDEVWSMTLGQIRALEYEHAVCNGLIKEDKIVNIDDVI